MEAVETTPAVETSAPAAKPSRKPGKPRKPRNRKAATDVLAPDTVTLLAKSYTKGPDGRYVGISASTERKAVVDVYLSQGVLGNVLLGYGNTDIGKFAPADAVVHALAVAAADKAVAESRIDAWDRWYLSRFAKDGKPSDDHVKLLGDLRAAVAAGAAEALYAAACIIRANGIAGVANGFVRNTAELLSLGFAAPATKTQVRRGLVAE